MQGRNGNTDAEHGAVDTGREEESEMKGESSINTHTLSCVEWIAGEKLLCKTESQPSVGLRDDLEGEPGGAKGSSRPKGHVFLLCGGNQGSIAERLSAKKERKKERKTNSSVDFLY